MDKKGARNDNGADNKLVPWDEFWTSNKKLKHKKKVPIFILHIFFSF